MAEQLKFVDSHNIIGYLMDPPAAHKEFKSMIVGLNNCKISHALRVTPVICKDLINDFWKNASFKCTGADGVSSIESTVKGKHIIITEQVIREVLQFGDQPEFPTEFTALKVTEVLQRMGYEGVYPPTAKKLLPPYWRFLAHTFVSCISGRKGGADEISQTATSACVALIMDWEYNFSKFVFDEMKSNLLGKKKDIFLMYPRFLQMIFDEMHPDLERTADKLDVRAFGPNTFGLLKQNRKATKVVFKGTDELVKFGKFAETEDVEAVSTINVEVPDEHVVPKSNLSFSFEDISDDDEENQDNQITKQEFEDFIQQSILTPKKDAVLAKVSQQDVLIPPQSVSVGINEAAESDLEDSTFALLLRKRKRRDPRPEVLITDVVQKTSTPIEPSSMAQNVQSPITESTPVAQDTPSPIPESIPMDQDVQENQFVEEVIPSEAVQVAGSSFIPPELDISKGKSKLSESELVDVVQLRNRVFDLEQDSTEKDLIIGKLDIRIRKLEKENSEKDSKISELQTNLGDLTVLFFDLKQRLFQKFGDEFQSLSVEREKITASSSCPVDPVPQPSCERVGRPAPDENTNPYLSTGPNTAEERRERQRKIDQHKLKKVDLLIMKNSDQNVPGDHPEMFVREVRKFTDKYGGRSGIIMWGYDADKKMWIVKRKSGKIEYYEKKVDFVSWTKVDLSELIHAPFHNPTNEPMAWSFKKFLEEKAKKNFEDLKTASSFTKKAKGVIDPDTNKTMVNVIQ